MSDEVRAAIVEAAGAPPIFARLQLPDLVGDEVRVRIGAAGICHTDLSVASGLLQGAYPVVLGHEGAGTVESVGPEATRFRPGDRVVVSVASHCGHCPNCEAGCPPLCVERGRGRDRFFRDGAVVWQGYGVGTFSEVTIVRERSLVAVPDGVPMEVAALAGCAAVTGLGAALNIAQVKPGSTVLVIGCGGVGLCAVMGAVLAGAERVVAVDPRPDRRAAALELGATDGCEASEEALRALAPAGFDYVFEAGGRQETVDLSVAMAGPMGMTLLMGLPASGTMVSAPVLDLANWAKSIVGVNMGSFRPNLDMGRYFRLYLRGKLPLDRLVSARVPLAEAARGFTDATNGSGLRIMLVPG